MDKSSASFRIKGWARSIDWRLLLFMLMLMNVKLAVKIAGVVLIYCLRPDFKFGIHFKKSRIPLFYPLIIALVLFGWLFSGLIKNINYDLTLITGIFFWLLCLLAFHQIKYAIEKNTSQTIHQTIFVFLIINAALSLLTYAYIMWDAGSMNPYRYQGQFQKYFMGTGDYIKGITMDTSTTNAILNAFAVIYFLSRGKYLPMLLCMLVLILTGSNVTNLLLFGTFIVLFIFKTSKAQKSMIVVCLAMLVAFMAGISPQNNDYVEGITKKIFNKVPTTVIKPVREIPLSEKPDSILSAVERKQKIAQDYIDSTYVAEHEKLLQSATLSIAMPGKIDPPGKLIIVKDDIHSAGFQHKNDTTVTEAKLIAFVKEKKAELPINGENLKPRLPGKLLAFKQTIQYLKEHPSKILFGTGIGNFSSKLAFKVTAMKIAGGYPAQFAYLNKAFELNHLDLYLYFFTGKDEQHSIANSPNSVYDQLISEYGLAGLGCFGLFYLGFFAKHLKKLTYGTPILLLMVGFFLFDYWFEQLSVVIFF